MSKQSVDCYVLSKTQKGSRQEKSTNSLPKPFWNSKKAENSMNSLTTEQNESLNLNLKRSKLKRV